MSASNWQVCPRCLDRAHTSREAEVARVDAMYGRVPVEEFDAAREAIPDVDPRQMMTFREDYEFYGAETGKVNARYEGRCTTCGLTASIVADHHFYDGDAG